MRTEVLVVEFESLRLPDSRFPQLRHERRRFDRFRQEVDTGLNASRGRDYLRHANGVIRLAYNLQTFTVSAESSDLENAIRVANLDRLLNLSARWTGEFKAEYARQQDTLRRRQRQNRPPHSQIELQTYIEETRADLSPTEPNYEVHSALFTAMLDRSRLAAWRVELGL
jgi:hypothetical protein